MVKNYKFYTYSCTTKMSLKDLLRTLVEIRSGKLVSPHKSMVRCLFNRFSYQNEQLNKFIEVLQRICDETPCHDALTKEVDMTEYVMHFLTLDLTSLYIRGETIIRNLTVSDFVDRLRETLKSYVSSSDPGMCASSCQTFFEVDVPDYLQFSPKLLEELFKIVGIPTFSGEWTLIHPASLCLEATGQMCRCGEPIMCESVRLAKAKADLGL